MNSEVEYPEEYQSVEVSETKGVGFLEVYIDLEKNDPMEVFVDLPREFYEEHHNPEKCCRYLCELNNLAIEHRQDYPKKISQIDVFFDFAYVLIKLTHELPEETVVDMPALFSYWIDFLNENADWIDKLKNNAWEDTGNYFFNKIKAVIENDNDEQE